MSRRCSSCMSAASAPLAAAAKLPPAAAECIPARELHCRQRNGHIIAPQSLAVPLPGTDVPSPASAAARPPAAARCIAASRLVSVNCALGLGVGGPGFLRHGAERRIHGAEWRGEAPAVAIAREKKKKPDDERLETRERSNNPYGFLNNIVNILNRSHQHSSSTGDYVR